MKCPVSITYPFSLLLNNLGMFILNIWTCTKKNQLKITGKLIEFFSLLTENKIKCSNDIIEQHTFALNQQLNPKSSYQ